MADENTKQELSLSDLYESKDVETVRGRAFTVALATNGIDADTLKAEIADSSFDEAITILSKYFELT